MSSFIYSSLYSFTPPPVSTTQFYTAFTDSKSSAANLQNSRFSGRVNALGPGGNHLLSNACSQSFTKQDWIKNHPIFPLQLLSSSGNTLQEAALAYFYLLFVHLRAQTDALHRLKWVSASVRGPVCTLKKKKNQKDVREELMSGITEFPWMLTSIQLNGPFFTYPGMKK